VAKHTTAIVVSHTHWDREWYLPFQRFRIRLVDMVDSLLEILDSEPTFEYFTLDGQAIVLEDYLEIRPENRERIDEHVKQGRLLVGPWYVLPDEFLVSGESLIRNLMLGHLIAQKHGGVMRVGYLPDTFGHPAQIPQILLGFGIDNAVIYRGVQTSTSEFMWESPDGSRVLTVFLPGGYCNAMQLAAAPNRFLDRLGAILDSVQSLATTDTVLLMNGCDHLPPRRDTARIVDEANRRLNNGLKLQQGTLPQYLQRIKEANPDLPTLRGEFRKPRPGRITPGVVSARMYLKQENFKSTNALERYAEPLSTLAWMVGQKYPQAFLWQAWKYLLQNHPHDSICGCSVDEVHQDMMARFRWTQQIASDLVHRGLDALSSNISSLNGRNEAGLLLYNPLGHGRRDYAHHYVHLLNPGQQLVVRDLEGKIVPHQEVARRPTTMHYDPLPARVELDGKQKPSMVVESPSTMDQIVSDGVWRQWRGEEIELLIAPHNIPPCGYTSLRVSPLESLSVIETDLVVGPDSLENDSIKVTVSSNGSFDLLDKTTGVVYAHLNTFQDLGDIGDEYTYCPPCNDSAVTSRECCGTLSLVEEGPVRATFKVELQLNVPRRASDDRTCRSRECVPCNIITMVSISTHSRRVEIHTTVENYAEDNLLRVLFPTPVQTEWSYSQGQFEVVRRPINVDPAELTRAPGPDEELAVGSFPQRAFVDVSDGEKGLAVLNRGLTEYEVLPGERGVTVALTLLRSVGWLSRSDLTTRHGNAGPSLPTPEAQCLGHFTFEYAVVPHSGTWYTAGIQQEAERYVAPPIATVLKMSGGALPPEFSFFAIEPDELVLSALKKAEHEDAVVLRLYNTTASSVNARIRVGRPLVRATLCNLAEQDIEERESGQSELHLDGDGSLRFPVKGFQIRTLKLVFQ